MDMRVFEKRMQEAQERRSEIAARRKKIEEEEKAAALEYEQLERGIEAQDDEEDRESYSAYGDFAIDEKLLRIRHRLSQRYKIGLSKVRTVAILIEYFHDNIYMLDCDEYVDRVRSLCQDSQDRRIKSRRENREKNKGMVQTVIK